MVELRVVDADMNDVPNDGQTTGLPRRSART